MVEAPLIALGVVVRAHGLRGEVRVHRFNPDSDLLLGRESVWLLPPSGEPRRVAVLGARAVKGAVLVQFEGVSDRDQAEALRGHEVAVARDELPDPDEDELYLADLAGLEAYEGDARLGVVLDVVEYPSAICLVVEGDDGLREVPMLPRYVVDVDVEGGRISVENVAELPIEPPSKKRS